MALVKLQIPDQLGAVNVHVTDDAGNVVSSHQLITPQQRNPTFTVPGAGLYTLYWQPVGGQIRPQLFRVGEGDTEVAIPWVNTGRFIEEIAGRPQPPASPSAKTRKSASSTKPARPKAAKSKAADPSADVWKNLGSAIDRFSARRSVAMTSSLQPAFRSPYLNETDTPSPPATSTTAPSPAIESESRSNPKMSVGVASDSAPTRMGGWKPYFAKWPIRFSRATGQLAFEIDRDSAPLDPRGLDGARVRFSVALQGRYLRRFLVPLFAGGVTVLIRSSGLSGEGMSFSILPKDPKTRVLVQALASSSSEEARRITSEIEMTADHFLARLAGGQTLDPWIAATLGLIVKRYDWSEDCSWCLEMAEKFEWVVDTLILSAWWKSTATGGRDYAACLDYLSRARHGGAPYFADANATMGDLLIWMASDLEDEALREQAREELARWRSNIVLQSRAGVSFAWRTEHGDHSKGRVARSTDLVAYEGDFADAFSLPT
jgi:hypothetical protein